MARVRKRPADALSRALKERDEALAFQAATDEILTAISRSSSDAKPVFDAIVRCVPRLFGTRYVAVFLVKGDELHLAASKADVEYERRHATVFRRFRDSFPQPIDWKGFTGRALHSGKVSQIAPIIGNPKATPQAVKLAKEFGYNAMLVAPLVRDGKAIGAIGTTRPEAKLFNARELALFTRFAAQAVIAIENARLFNEATEALEQQTATSDILRVISSSPGDIGPVLDTILENGLRLCEARYGSVFTFDGEAFRVARSSGQLRPEFLGWLRSAAIKPGRETPLRRVGLELRPVHCIDLLSDSSYSPPPEYAQECFRTALAVPVLKDGKLIGALAFHRREVRPFSDRQIALLQTFAAQAVIAIENTRLFNETREALERQTSSAEILRVIAGTPADARPVFEAIAQSALRVFGASHVGVTLREPGGLRSVATAGSVDPRGEFLIPVNRDSTAGRAVLDRVALDIPDTEAQGAPAFARESGRVVGFRAIAAAPMLRHGEAIGSVHIMRKAPGTLSEAQMALLRSFADQAVIAIENARLFNETKEALEQQTATTNILRVISRSVTDLAPVFEEILENAITLCEGNVAALWQYDGNHLCFAAGKRVSPEATAHYRSHPLALGTYNPTPQAALERRTLHVLDVFAERTYRPLIPREIFTSGLHAPTVLAVPLLRENDLLGVVTIWRYQKRLFTDRQVAMVNTFAAQAVIAIENVRLFNETKEAFERQKASAEILGTISSSIADTEPVFEKILESCERLFAGRTVGINVLGEDGMIHLGAYRGAGREAFEKVFPLPVDANSGSGLAIVERRVVHIPDSEADGVPEAARRGNRARGNRASLYAPMMSRDKAIGVIWVARELPGPFSEKEIGLLKTFADQAVIAIENARLFNETKEALERQTATADILKVISGSPTATQPVFDAIVKSCFTLFKVGRVSLWIVEGDRMRLRARVGAAAENAGAHDQAPLDRNSALGACVLESRTIHLPNLEAAAEQYPRIKQLGLKYGYRSGIYAPLLRERRAIGGISLLRGQPGAFSDKEVALLRTFADQAVIAIENARLFNETKEALEQQTATSEILSVIANSRSEVQPVLDAVGRNAAHLCEANNAVIFRLDGDLLRQVASYGGVPTSSHPSAGLQVNRSTVTGRAVVERQTIHVHDLAAETSEFPDGSRHARRDGHRTTLAAPLMREGAPIGAILIRRMEVRPFSDKQIALLKTFADQAAIAIENVRLFNETKEALEQQTATAGVLRVIAASPTDLKPVMNAVVERAARLLEADHALIGQSDGENIHWLAAHGCPVPDGARSITRQLPSGRAILDLQTTQIEDIGEIERDALIERSFSRFGVRTICATPLIREGRAIGVILVRRTQVRPFTEKQMSLLRTFADQAVVAIENVRLFNETKEALERQTATAEILKVISASPSDVQPVFNAVAVNAARVCGVDDVAILRTEGADLRRVAHYGSVPVSPDTLLPVPPGSVNERVLSERRTLHVPDTAAPSFAGEFPGSQFPAMGVRALLATPLVHDGMAVGVIHLRRSEPRSFTDKQIALLETFADQAVIAIENVRLFNETKEALERQIATGEILASMSGSMTDTKPVFDAILRNLLRLFGTGYAVVALRRGEAFELAGFEGEPGFERLQEAYPLPVDGHTSVGEAVIARQVRRYAPVAGNPAVPSRTAELCQQFGFDSVMAAPMMWKGEAIGAILTARRQALPFDDKQVALIQSFADQAVIAIENVRLFKELQERTAALTKSVDQLTALGEVGQAISSTLELETVLETIVQRAVQLAGLDGGSIYEFDEGDGRFHLRAAQNVAEEILAVYRASPIRLGEGAVGRAGATREPVAVDDVRADTYRSRAREMLIKSGARALLAVPLLREDLLLGALVVSRKSPGPFAPEVIDLLKTFATQSAVAIQNARLFREIEEKSRQLEEASRHKSQFLASMSHELRTPLNAILGFNEMILGQVYGEVPSDMKEPLEDIQKSGKHLLRLINNVLDLAKIEAGKMELALADYSVQDTVESVRSTLRPLAEAKGLELVVRVPEDIPLAYGDGGRLTQCLMNLAGNSLKFTKEGKVEIAVEAENGHLRWRVSDTGIGIPPDKIPTLFSEFKQTDATIASEYGGTGLGLSITKKFVEMHGGRIWVESEPGKGSVFTVEVPLRVKAPA